MSRCAPASDPPTTVRGSCHTLALSPQSASDSGIGGRSPVRSSSARTTSTSVSKGSCPRSAAISPTVRPASPALAGLNVSSTVRILQSARAERMPASLECAPRSSRLRSSGSARRCIRSGISRANTSRQPGRPSSTAPCSKERRILTVWGRVRATTTAPRSAAAVDASSWRSQPSGLSEDTPSTFQLTGRSASSESVVMRSTSSSVNPLRHPGTMSSRTVPSCSDTAEHRASSSSRVAALEGTGLPSPSLWVWAREVDSPSAPSSKHALARATMAATSVGDAGRWTASSPMTTRRSEECPTRNPALTPMPPSKRPSHSPNEPHDQSSGLEGGQGHPLDPGHHPGQVVGRGLARTGPGRSRSSPRSRWSRRGVVTGWPRDPMTAGRRSGCGGRRTPGRPAGRRRRWCVAASSTWPTATTRPRCTPTSARRAGAPVPSTSVPPRMARSSISEPPLPCRRPNHRPARWPRPRPRPPSPDAAGPCGC